LPNGFGTHAPKLSETVETAPLQAIISSIKDPNAKAA
jgi:hypothetical protein